MVGLTAALAGSGINTTGIELHHQPIRIPDLPPAFHGYRIGFISDIHVGPCSDTSLVKNAIELLKQEKPDLIILGGDYILLPDYLLDQTLLSVAGRRLCIDRNRSYEEGLAQAEEPYSSLALLFSELQPPDGCFAVPGNHDTWVSLDSWKRNFSQRGVAVLSNDLATIRKDDQVLVLWGTDDYWAGIPKVPTLRARQKEKELRIIVSHNPDYLSELMRRGKFDFDLGLSGHTHGGQIRLPFLGAIHYNVRDTRMADGLFQCPQGQVYTTRGLGVVGVPLRMNCPPEVAILSLEPKNAVDVARLTI